MVSLGGIESIYKYHVQYTQSLLAAALSLFSSVGKTRLNGSCICAACFYPLSVPPEKLISPPLIGRQVTVSTNERLGQLWVDIDGIKMTEGNYIELRRAAGFETEFDDNSWLRNSKVRKTMKKNEQAGK